MSAERNKLPRSLSLKRRLDIDDLFKKGKRFSGRYCTILWQTFDLPEDTGLSDAGKQLRPFQYGVFVSKKLGGAVKRNRLKRLFREAIRMNRHRLARKGRLGIVPTEAERIPKKREIESELRSLIEKITD